MATPKRQGTMQQTASEGVQYLKAEGKDELIKKQGLDKTVTNTGNANSPEKPSMPAPDKQGTMHATAKEGNMLMGWMGGAPDPDAKTRGQQKELEKKDEPPIKKAKPAKEGTMIQTTKEAKDFLGKEALGESRSETETAKRAAEANAPPAVKKTLTMQATTQESITVVPKPQEVGGTRAETAQLQQAEKDSKKRKAGKK